MARRPRIARAGEAKTNVNAARSPTAITRFDFMTFPPLFGFLYVVRYLMILVGWHGQIILQVDFDSLAFSNRECRQNVQEFVEHVRRRLSQAARDTLSVDLGRGIRGTVIRSGV